MNTFSLGAQIGGPDAGRVELDQQLRDALNRWNGEYTSAIREFAFLLRVDGSIHEYTKTFKIHGAQPAKRKRDWIEVEIGVPSAWWRDMTPHDYKTALTNAIEQGFLSMIDLLRRNGHALNVDALLSDWRQIKAAYLACG
jgi:hypothetical protein